MKKKVVENHVSPNQKLIHFLGTAMRGRKVRKERNHSLLGEGRERSEGVVDALSSNSNCKQRRRAKATSKVCCASNNNQAKTGSRGHGPSTIRSHFVGEQGIAALW